MGASVLINAGWYKTLRERSTAVELKINTLKRDTFWHYQRHRYLDVFRYDTEAKVFKKLEELRGIDRRTNALISALRTLEDYANDVDRRQAEAARASDEAQRTSGEKRQAGLRNVLAGILPCFRNSDFCSRLPIISTCIQSGHLAGHGLGEPLSGLRPGY